MKIVLQFLLRFIGLTLIINHAAEGAVMSIDLGSEIMKIGIISPGVPMDIVLNNESKRKTPAVISYRDNIRTFGEDAQTVGIKYPQNSYIYLLDLLGKDINHPIVQLYKQHFPYYNIVEDTERGTILFQHDENTQYSIEELIAQLLNLAKGYAERYSRQHISECVLTVPGFFNQAERKAMLQAAKLSGLKVLQLINDYTAVALNYGIYRKKEFNESAQYVMFIDIGASSTSAVIVSYQTVKTKERGIAETHPQLTVLGVGYDRTLGGRLIQIKLRDYLATKFNELKKTPNDVFKNARAMAKLYKEAGRVKTILSANFEHFAQIEGLLDDIDFKIQVTREDLETLCADFFDRVSGPVEQAVKLSGLSVDLLNQVVLFGASTRIPKVQQILRDLVGQDLAKNLNTDEAAALGAVYKAADLSSGFQVTKFITKDAVIFPIQVVFDRESEGVIKQVQRTLFGPMNPYPQKKIITFNKHSNDFSFNINHADLNHLSNAEILNLGSLNLTEISLIKVADVFKKHVGENVENKGIKAHFSLDESGVLKFVNAELVLEKTVLPDDASQHDEGTLSKLGNTISKLFTGESEVPENTESSSKETDENVANEQKTVNETESKNDTSTEPPKESKPTLVTLKEPIEATEKILHINSLNRDQFQESYKKLQKLIAVEHELNRRANAINSLEAFVMEIQHKLDDPEYAEIATEQELKEIRTASSEALEWLYEEGFDSDAETYESKLNTLNLLAREFHIRIIEHQDRPEAINNLNVLLSGSKEFLEHAKNFTKSNAENPVFTDVEIETLEKLINETVAWLDQAIEEQNKLKKSDTVVLSLKGMLDKRVALDREIKYLGNKLKMWKPKKTEKPKEPEKTKPVTESESLPTAEQKEVEVEPTGDEPITQDEDNTLKPTKSDTSDTHSEL